MIVLGITGGIGSGKSLVCDYLENEYNAYVLKTDDIGHDVMAPGGRCYNELVKLIGENYLDSDGSINRKELGTRVFNEPELLLEMNRIIHPAVFDEVKSRLERESESCRSIAVVESALLIEAGYRSLCDEFWFVYVEKEERIRRLLKSRDITEEKVESIMDKQLSDDIFKDKCDFVIDNSCGFELTAEQIDNRLEKLEEKQ